LTPAVIKSIIAVYQTIILGAEKMDNMIDKIKKATQSEPKKPEQQFMKLIEEVGEASQAYLSSEGASGNKYKHLDQSNVKEELVDVLLVTFALLSKVGATDEEIEELINRKVDKWIHNQNH
jgi:NTP pyrophosphatase (non-canonical NTP hydrolase)